MHRSVARSGVLEEGRRKNQSLLRAQQQRSGKICGRRPFFSYKTQAYRWEFDLAEVVIGGAAVSGGFPLF
ncbi:unnamed protein product [Linum tenue]|uniref:Uncharacterized protein n=1 Tax=Linum tenue TaxID=586396 RepID=A0AAV0LK02_9ROSI|nr:unnamed protein product [Linum tenue]